MNYDVVTPTELEEVVKYCVEENKNLNIMGPTGCGKTTVPKKVIKAMGLNFLFKSVPTMDPLVDIIGLPRTVEKEGEISVQYIREESMVNGSYDVYIFDEYNRPRDPKVIDAIMELMATRTVNNKPVKGLRCVITTMNPHDNEDYNVDILDKAQLDRSTVNVQLEMGVNWDYLVSEYGEYGKIACEEWEQMLPEFMNNGRITEEAVTPRKLEEIIKIHLSNEKRASEGKWTLPLTNISNTELTRNLERMFIDKQLSTKSILDQVMVDLSKLEDPVTTREVLDYMSRKKVQGNTLFNLEESQKLHMETSEQLKKSDYSNIDETTEDVMLTEEGERFKNMMFSLYNNMDNEVRDNYFAEISMEKKFEDMKDDFSQLDPPEDIRVVLDKELPYDVLMRNFCYYDESKEEEE